MRKNKVFLLAIAVLILSAAFCCIASASLNSATSNIFSTSNFDDFSNFNMENLVPFDATGWVLSDGSEPVQRHEKGLSGYVYSDTMSRSVSSFSAEFDSPIDAYAHRQISFLIHISEAENTKKEIKRTVFFTLGSGENSIICRGEIRGEGWHIITFDVGSWKYRKNIDSIKLRISGDGHRPVRFFAEISGPYVREASEIGMERFMSYGLYASGSELEILDRGSAEERLRVYLGAGRVTVSGIAAVPYSEDRTNAIRIIMTCDSELESMSLTYNYLDTVLGKYISKTKNVPIEHGVGSFPYIIGTDDVSLISSFSLVLDSASQGSVTIHSIEPVSVYEGYSEETYGELSQPRWDARKKTLTLSGSIFHGYLVSHDDHTLVCYKLSSFESFDDVIARGDAPVSVVKMSSKFSFELKAESLGEMASISKYAVASRAPNGELTLVASPVCVSGDLATADTSLGRINIKGLVSDRISEAVDCGVGTSVIDVYLNKLVNTTHAGHLYTIGNSFIYFNADYVALIDNKVKNLSAAGCKVYLRLLISAKDGEVALPYAARGTVGEDTELLAVNIADMESQEHFFGVVDFLAGRYSSSKNGRIKGMILGRNVDLFEKYNFSGDEDLVSYSATVARAFEIMARSAMTSIDDFEAILPISDAAKGGDGYETELLLTSVTAYLNQGGGLKYSVLLEGSHTPYSLEASMFGEGEDKPLPHPADGHSDYYSTDNIYIFERFLDHLGHTYACAPVSYIYYWRPDLSAIGEGLSHAYIFNYYSVMFSDKASALILELPVGEEGKNAFARLNYLIKYIDTSKNSDLSMAEPSLSIFGGASWKDLISDFDKELILYRSFYEADGKDILPEGVKGSYTLWDFSKAFGVLDWFEGSGCTSVSLDSSSDGTRSLRADLGYSDGSYAYSELVYSFSYPDDLSLMPYLQFDLTIEGGGKGELYEVLIIIGGDGNRIETRAELFEGENTSVIVDTSLLSDIKTAEYIRICVRRMSTIKDGEISLYLKKVIAHSDRYDSAGLMKAIDSARAKAKNTAPVSAEYYSEPNYDIVIAILFIIPLSIIIVGFFDKKNRTQ